MRILHLYSGNLYGGVEVFLRTLARYRAETPWVEMDVALCFDGRLADELRREGVDVCLLGAVRASSPRQLFAARRVLAGMLDSREYQVVVCHSAWPHALFAPVVRRRGHRLAFHMHDVPNRRGWPDLLANRTLPDLVICNSEYTARSGRWFFRGVRRCVVRCPVSTPFDLASSPSRETLRASLGASPDDVVILQASRMQPWKGQHGLLEALARLPRRLSWSCWIAGAAQRPSETRYEKELECLVRKLDLGDRVRLLGQRQDVPALMRAADVFCQVNARPEPFGIVFVEALAAGLPVVAANSGGAPEIVTRSCGLLADPNPRSVAAALESLIADAQKRSELSNAGPARATELCDPRARVRELHSVLASIAPTLPRPFSN